MPKTFADMTTQERTQCVGMWCYIFERLDEPPVNEGIIAGYRKSDDGRTLVIIDHPHPDAGKWGCELNEVVPRPDLPRAWQADGTPPAGEWEHAEYLGDYKGMTDVYYFDGEPTHRRWKGEWEEA